MNVGKALRVHRVEPVEDPVPRKRAKRKQEKKPAVPTAAAKAPRAV